MGAYFVFQGSSMLVSDWLNECNQFTHSAIEYEASVVSVDAAHHGSYEVVFIRLERADGQQMTLRMRKDDARSFALQIRNLWPTVYGDH